MKTFNSIFANGNVKSIIAIAAVAISSVFGLSSCEKDNEAFNNGTHTTTTTPIEQSNTGVLCTYHEPTYYTANMAVSTTKDYAGTYKCTADDGKEWIVVLTENATASEGNYSATITVPEGEVVAAKTYDGYFKVINNSVLFYSTETKGGADNNNLVNFKMDNKDNTKNFTAILKLNNRGIVKTLEFVKQ